MDNKTKKTIIVVVAAALLIIAVEIYIYINTLNNAIELSTVSTIKELSAHDLKSIRADLSNSWEGLSRIYERVRHSEPETVQDVCSSLSFEQEAQRFTMLFLVDENGNTYSGTNAVRDSSKSEHIRQLLSGKKKVAVNYSDASKMELEEEALAYGVRMEPFEAAGVKFIGAVGYTESHYLRSRMRLTCFGGEGSTSVIDGSGDYLVKPDGDGRFSKINNFFDKLEEAYDQNENDIEQIKEKIDRGRKFYEQYENNSGRRRIVYYVPMKEVGWTMIITVPGKVMNDLMWKFVGPALIMLMIVMAILVLLASIVIKFVMSTVKMKAQAKASSELLSNMSHEIRTPLNGMIGLNSLMQKNIDNPVKLREYLYKSAATGEYLITLVNDILDMSKLQAGKTEIMENPFSLSDMIVDIYTIEENDINKKNIRFAIEPEILADHIVGDESRIKQILINILSNAVKFTGEEGKITFRIRQTLLEEDEVKTVFDVDDNGCGMSKEFQKKIFDAFSQERYKKVDSGNGTGLGMAISSLLARKMGGTLSVQSKENVGSRFTFSLVSKRIGEQEEAGAAALLTGFAEPKNAADPHRLNSRKLHILLAEDNELNAEILLELLEGEGVTVDHAADGFEVVELFARSEPGTYDLILMDVQMPKRNGYEATKVIRSLKRKDAASIVIFACTANAFKEDEEKALECGMNDFITKPINMQKLMEKIGEGVGEDGQ